MGNIVKSITVAVPVERAFGYVTDWHNVSKYQEEYHEYRPVSQRTTGDGARFAYKVLSGRGELDVEAQYSEYRENAGLVITALRGPRIIERWTFAADAPGTCKITYAVEYPLPANAAGGVMGLFMLKGAWSDKVKKVLRKLKELLEKA